MERVRNHRTVAERRGGPDVLQVVAEDLPEPRPGELREAIARFVACHDSERYHGALRSATPGDVRYGRREAIVSRRKGLAIRTVIARRAHYRRTMREAEGTETGTPEASPDSSPGLSQQR